MKNKKKSYHWIRNRMIILLVVIVFILFFGIKSMNSMIEPRIKAYANQYLVSILNDASQHILKDLNYASESLYTIVYDEKGNITNIQYDSYRMNQMLYEALNKIGEQEKYTPHKKNATDVSFLIENVTCDIPIGYFSQIPFFANKGVPITFSFQMMNDVTGQLKIDTKPYGMNNTLLSIAMQISVTSQIVTVFDTYQITIQQDIPIVMQVIQGVVPTYPSIWGNNQ